MRFLILCLAASALVACTTDSATGETGGDSVTFVVTLENVGTPLMTSNGPVDHMFAPGIWALHGEVNAIFTPGEADRGQGLEALAEDGNNAPLGGALSGVDGVDEADIFSIPQGTYDAGAILPGDTFEFEITAVAGQHLSFAGMLVQSNDIFAAPGPGGLELFDADGAPIVGDRSAELELWDAGTEVNEEPGVGENQAPRQAAPNTGMDEGGVVQKLADVGDGFTYPTAAEFLKVTVAVKPAE